MRHKQGKCNNHCLSQQHSQRTGRMDQHRNMLNHKQDNTPETCNGRKEGTVHQCTFNNVEDLNLTRTQQTMKRQINPGLKTETPGHEGDNINGMSQWTRE